MKTSGLSLGLLNAPVLCLLWLTKHAVGSAQLSAPDVVTGARGGSVTVPCQYELQFRDYTKYWCRGQIYELCEIVVKTPRRSRKGRSTIADDKKAGVFTVTLTSLRESDEDKYWCVIARSGRNIHTSVKLRVSHSVTTTTTATILEPDEICWWATLRWILSILMLCCLVSTHVAAWRITAAGKQHL
ncbi:CMRF35-like molecule 3 [Pseudoliparis swirei]|uniref:CMRF35-like molecule 3 n=1 Tax=Pseudoliparis swirei TaxID=2059687 RepID=UPI0024BD9F40|nr:CMRF35-like molecule 3 [Pseudoliparis swirei]